MSKKNIKREKTKSWWQILLCRILGLFLILAPILIWLSLLGYDSNDPSFNKATTAEVHNFMGSFGAYSADAVLSTFGLSLIIFLVVPLLWGITLFRYNTLVEYKVRILAWVVGTLSFAAFLDLTCYEYLKPYNLSGDWSKVISRPLNTYINMLNVSYNTLLLEGIILFLSMISFNLAAGITFKRWSLFLENMWLMAKKIYAIAAKIFKKIVRIKDYNEFKEINPSYLQSHLRQAGNRRREPKLERKEPNITEKPADANVQIEIPTGKAGTKNTVNPTFDFVSDSDEINQSNKPKNRKISPEEIYKTEGIKSFFPKLKRTQNNLEDNSPKQAELLDIEQQTTPTTARKSQKVENVNNVAPQPKQSEYVLPDINLLSAPKNDNTVVYDEAQLKENAIKLETVLEDFGIHGKIVKVRPGPVVTLYELEPAPGTRTARVIGLSDDIARSMAVASVRMAVVAGHNTIGIELPNEKRETVWLRELLENPQFKNSKNILNVGLGKDIGGQPVYADISKMPHLLVAGTTGSGKSVGVNTMILSLLYRMTPDECKLIMIDPKQLEFSMYNGIPHLLTPVITDPARAVIGLKWAVREMEDRYRSMALLNVRNIAGYNQKVAEMRNSGKDMTKKVQVGFDKETGRPIYEDQTIDTSPMPYIVIVVDEMADLMLVAGKEVEAAIQRLAQMARAAGIHIIMSTQRPSVDVITGIIKANFPSRISFHVTTKIDSRTILGEQGAEQLLGMGDMLYMPSGLRPVRVHGCFVADAEVERIVEYIKSQGEPHYVSEVTEGELNTKDTPVFDKGNFAGDGSDDDLYNQAVAIVRADKKASTSYIQRKLRLGYNRAAVLIERMEDEGIVTPPDRVGRREVIGE